MTRSGVIGWYLVCSVVWCGLPILYTYIRMYILTNLLLCMIDTAASLLDTNVISVARSSKPSVPSVRKVTLDHLKKSIPASKVTRVAQDRHEVCNRHMHCAHTLDTHTHARAHACTHTHNTDAQTHRHTRTHCRKIQY